MSMIMEEFKIRTVQFIIPLRTPRPIFHRHNMYYNGIKYQWTDCIYFYMCILQMTYIRTGQTRNPLLYLRNNSYTKTKLEVIPPISLTCATAVVLSERIPICNDFLCVKNVFKDKKIANNKHLYNVKIHLYSIF
jgi:hypothetical protein